MLTLQEVKDFLKIDISEDDPILTLLMQTSEEFVKNATHKQADNTKANFKLCQLFLIAHWYENPTMVNKVENMPFHLESLLLQIRATTDVST